MESLSQSQIALVQRAEGSLFTTKEISEHLKLMDYPEKALDLMLNCGEKNGLLMTQQCNCRSKVIHMVYHCNMRTCPRCAEKRRKHLRRKYLPHLRTLSRQRGSDQFYFLTISPPNFKSFSEGLANIKASFKKFLRTKYVSERIKGGLYVIETKKTAETWNIHIHCIFYGRRLDNRLRGRCFDCGQNLIKIDPVTKKVYCGNHNCNSLNVEYKIDSKLVTLYKISSGGDVHIDLRSNKNLRRTSTKSTLNYMLKYVSSNKENFDSAESVAKYIIGTRNQRLLTTFGTFYNQKVSEAPIICPYCHKPITFTFDFEISSLLLDQEGQPPPAPPSDPLITDFFENQREKCVIPEFIPYSPVTL